MGSAERESFAHTSGKLDQGDNGDRRVTGVAKIPMFCPNSRIRLDMVQSYHLLCIVMAALSLCTFFVVFEIIPALSYFYFRSFLRVQTEDHRNLYTVNILVTSVVTFVVFAIVLFMGLIEGPLWFLLMLLVLPFLFVITVTFLTRPREPAFANHL